MEMESSKGKSSGGGQKVVVAVVNGKKDGRARRLVCWQDATRVDVVDGGRPANGRLRSEIACSKGRKRQQECAAVVKAGGEVLRTARSSLGAGGNWEVSVVTARWRPWRVRERDCDEKGDVLEAGAVV